MKIAVISNRPYSDWIRLEDPKRLIHYLKILKPDAVFFPFWSDRVPKNILDKYACYGFHTGKLPEEAGGSPIQNLIRLGRKASVVNLFSMNDKIDGGEVLLKREVTLDGSLEEILLRIKALIVEMIDEFQKDYR